MTGEFLITWTYRGGTRLQVYCCGSQEEAVEVWNRLLFRDDAERVCVHRFVDAPKHEPCWQLVRWAA